MSRYDYIKIWDELLPVNTLQRKDLSGLEFQTKSLDREFLEYYIDCNGIITYIDYEYELVHSNDGPFSFKLKRIDIGVKSSYYTGDVLFYGKPYDVFYIFKANFNNGVMTTIERVIK
jgi:hypothetical protein